MYILDQLKKIDQAKKTKVMTRKENKDDDIEEMNNIINKIY